MFGAIISFGIRQGKKLLSNTVKQAKHVVTPTSHGGSSKSTKVMAVIVSGLGLLGALLAVFGVPPEVVDAFLEFAKNVAILYYSAE